MKVYNEKSSMTDQLNYALEKIRVRRQFNAKTTLRAKCDMINQYFSNANLVAAVVGVSGGIDSAVVLGLLMHASRQKGSRLKRIVGLPLPALSSSEATNQTDSLTRAQEVINFFGLPANEIDMTPIVKAIVFSEEKASIPKGGAWARGQLIAYARTPVLYYATSCLTESGQPALVAGTTNRDEGAYLGYVGKASDGMVDLQLISDLHKSEVYALAREMALPASVIDVIPSGDMYDGRVDEDVFGASYDFVELYINWLNLSDAERVSLAILWSNETWRAFNQAAEHLEKLHRYNGHKYRVGSPAFHLDIYESGVKGGWPVLDTPYYNAPVRRDFMVNEITNVTEEKELLSGISHAYCLSQDAVSHLKNVIEPSIAKNLAKSLSQKVWQPASVHGYVKEYTTGDIAGSWRASWFSVEWAKKLWSQINGLVPVLEQDENGCWWRAVGVNPLFRFIRYENDGFLVAHYDAPVSWGDSFATRKSVIICLGREGSGGETRFIDAPTDPEYKDWSRGALPCEVKKSFSLSAGEALVFDHRLLHDGAKVFGRKMIVRTDLVFVKARL